MKRILFPALVILLLLHFNVPSIGQNEKVDPYDFGRMWTFENPPVEWFRDNYGFDPGQEWFDHVRKSSLRFASWCSASFVSPDGLIMTNHHCSRGVSFQVQEEGEDFTSDGFYASALDKERRVSGLFVEQLIMAEDITMEYDQLLAAGTSVENLQKLFEEEYKNKENWENLRIQIVSYYSGAKHSVYGYKRYNDIRLVLVPEVKIGFFGGEDDNFTFPRYNLDFTFWRAYDSNGQPMDTKDHYMKFNPEGPKEGEPVFVIGNPARTERYKTVAQLEFDRDYRFPMLIDFYTELYDQFSRTYKEDPSPALLNRIFGLSNSLKVFNGITEGLNDPDLMGRKLTMEKHIRSSVKDQSPWVDMDGYVMDMENNNWAMNILGPTPENGVTFNLMHALAKYEGQLKSKADEKELDITRTEIKELIAKAGSGQDKTSLIKLLSRVEKYIPKDNTILSGLLEGLTISEYVEHLFVKSRFFKEDKADKILNSKPKKFLKRKDPLLEASRNLIGAYTRASDTFVKLAPKVNEIEKEIANRTFGIFGDQLSPDATFTLRISDGVVKGYDYNGTIAPYQTTFFGLYDRHFSHTDRTAWDLPEKWRNPDLEFLKTPVNFVSTNDIIGGNSGSPIINRDKEVVGLIFDGNIESLTSNFIYDDEISRSVSVHASGILAALKYIYKAERLRKELLGE